MGWCVALDRGGTFTDVVATAPDGRRIHRKLLNRRGTERQALEVITGDPTLGTLRRLRVGTTVATNALLTGTGPRTALVINRGFGDLLLIGHQPRPDLFELDIRRPAPLARDVLEIAGRLAVDGRELEPLDEGAVSEGLLALRARGVEALAICLLHGAERPLHEGAVAALAAGLGFVQVSVSHQVDPAVGFVDRARTTVAHAFLTPTVRSYVQELLGSLPSHVEVTFMRSSGGLASAAAFGGAAAVLSGPAGGVVACGDVARRRGEAVLGFDMGGTSTDVCRYAERADRVDRIVVQGRELRTPALEVHTVAAGGGSLVTRDGERLLVGPGSAGADPGPASYGRGGPAAVTDANVVLGRLLPDRFPAVFGADGARPLDPGAAGAALAAATGLDPAVGAAAAIAVANAAMADAVSVLSAARGHDPADHALVAFGGAAGQHACGVADRLGIRRVVLSPQAGVLSAAGIHGAPRSAIRRAPLSGPWSDELPARESPRWQALLGAAQEELRAGGATSWQSRVEWNLRYRGSETTLPASSRAEFEAAHLRLFGFARPDADVEVASLLVEAFEASQPVGEGALQVRPATPDERTVGFPDAEGGLRWLSCPVLERDALAVGENLAGPLVILDPATTIVVDPGWSARREGDGDLVLERSESAALPAASSPASGARLELAVRRCMSVAEQMGETLRRTAWSVNIRERLDFSCAVFDAGGHLVANAPHIPVHLGAMGETVRALLADASVSLAPGQAWATNDPACGGSHLPDITVITPVFAAGCLVAFVASRGHHADVGGVTPGSMPPHSRTLAEEGVVLRNLLLLERGRFQGAAVAAALHGVRDPQITQADLQAQIAAGELGARLLGELVARRGADDLIDSFAAVQRAAEASVRAWVTARGAMDERFEDALDDGTKVAVRVRLDPGAPTPVLVDFTGTGPPSAGNLNAPPAVCRAAVLYVLRCALARDVPLNEGCLRAVELVIPADSLLDPPAGAAVVGGNVETSQRVVDVLLGALGLAAASQGTMNNLTFGDEGFGAYETLAGGAGATPRRAGASGVHTHMTNTRITDAEVMERRLPVRVLRFSLRPGSGGTGRHPGGDGLVRELLFLRAVTVSLLSQRRTRRPFGLAGGGAGAAGAAWRLPEGTALPGSFTRPFAAGERIRVETPGGGGWGAALTEAGAASDSGVGTGRAQE